MAAANARMRPWGRRLGRFEWGNYALAGGLGISAELIRLSIRPLHAHNLYLLSLAAVMTSAWIGGVGPGLLALLLGGLTKINSSPTLNPGEASQLIVFCALALTAVWVTARTRHTRQILSTVLSNMRDAAVQTDASGDVVFLNRAGEALSGCRQKEAVGKPFGEIFPLSSSRKDSRSEDPFEGVLSLGRTVELTTGVILRSAGGAARRIQATATPVRNGTGRVKGMTVFFRDVISESELQEKRRQSEAADPFARLATGVAEDFNNSLTIITGHAELLRGRADAQGDSSLREDAEEILKASEQAAGATRELLGLNGRQKAQSPPVPSTQALSHEPKRDSTVKGDAATILVVEQDNGVRALLSVVLRKKGHVVLAAAGGVEAATIVAEKLNELDLIVADATMAVMGEHGLIERLAMLRPELKILYLSSRGTTLSWTHERAGGRVRFLSKPFSARCFLDQVESLLGR